MTEGRNWIAIAAVIIMMAGSFFSLIITFFIAWKLGVIERWKQGIHQMERQNDLIEYLVKVIEKCKGPQT